MNIFYAILLGIVQGLTEFLPVSSSGHLVLIEKILNISQDIVLFDLMLHLGTVLAVCVFYRKTLVKILKDPFGELSRKIIVACLPTIIIGLVFKDYFESAFSGEYLVCGFLVTAVFLVIMWLVQSKYTLNQGITYLGAIITGIFQGFAIMPGVSRSGSTITSCIVQGVDKEKATEFSFLLSVPIIVGSSVLELLKINKNIVIGAEYILVGVLTSFISGLVAIKIMNKVIKSNKYYVFIIYLLLLSGVMVYFGL